MDRYGRNLTKKKFLAVGEACMVISDLLQALRENICQLWVLNRRDLYSCVRSTSLRDSYQTQADDDLWVTALTG